MDDAEYKKTDGDELSPPDTGKAPIATIEKELTINFREPEHGVIHKRSSSKEPRRRRRVPSADARRSASATRSGAVEPSTPTPTSSAPSTPPPAEEHPIQEKEEEKPSEPPKPSFIGSIFELLREAKNQWPDFISSHPNEWQQLKLDRNRCFCDFIILVLYCGFGGFIFRFTESAFEQFYKCGVKRVKRDFVDGLWAKSQELRGEEWKSLARRKLMEFEDQLQEAYDAGVNTYSGKRSWSFLNAVVYSITVVTTIGYGHIAPSTTTGRAVTIIYAVFGIPLFLILLADFGKMFTRAMKFLWAFVRRLYYTGSCRTVRHTGPVQEVMKGVQLVYDIARFQRPSGDIAPGVVPDGEDVPNAGTSLLPPGIAPPEPPTPAPSNFCVDDEFNLPISVAIAILVAYILVGATLYCMWEEWTFFEAFYFVFISMSTIGFGDYVPKHPMFMMGSIVYLVFGLALTSMCINVVQVKLSDTFRQASSKIGATLGLRLTAVSAANTVAGTPAVELAQVHLPAARKASEETLGDLSPSDGGYSGKQQ